MTLAADTVRFTLCSDPRKKLRPRQRPVLAVVRLSLHQLVGDIDWRLVVVGGITNQRALVARALRARRPTSGRGVEHGAVAAVEAEVGRVVTDIEHRAVSYILEIDPRGGRDLAGDDRHACFDHRFHRPLRAHIRPEEGVEHGIVDRICNLARVAFGDGLRSEEEVVGHELVSCFGSKIPIVYRYRALPALSGSLSLRRASHSRGSDAL